MIGELFPYKLNDSYIFVKQLDIPEVKYYFGLYSKGKDKFIAKLWHSRLGLDKKTGLKNEINIYEKLSNEINRKVGEFYSTYWPKYAGSYFLDDGKMILLTKYTNGVQLWNLDDEKKEKIMIKMVYYSIRLHRLLPKVRIKSYKYSFFITIVDFYLEFFNSHNNRSYGYINKDINLGNILVDKKRIYIVDFQLFGIGHLEHSLANLLFSISCNGSWELFLKVMEAVLKSDSISKGLLKAYLNYAFLFDVSFGSGKGARKAGQFLQKASLI